MFTVDSETMTAEGKAGEVPVKKWKFQISNGNTGKVIISDPLLDSEARAEERAKSEFLRRSYAIKEVTFNTYRTDFEKNMIINIMGLPYIVKSIRTAIDSVSVKTNIRAIRYE